MSTTASNVPCHVTCLHKTESSYRFRTTILNRCLLPGISKRNEMFILQITTQNRRRKMDLIVHSSVGSGPPLPPDHSPSSWKFWILGMIATVIFPFWRNKWGPFLKLKREVDTVMETAEHVTEIIEKVADEVEEVAEKVAERLPDGGKLKDALTFVENVARETAKDAHLAEQVIDKVEEVEKELESFIEPATDQANEISQEAKGDQH